MNKIKKVFFVISVIILVPLNIYLYNYHGYDSIDSWSEVTYYGMSNLLVIIFIAFIYDTIKGEKERKKNADDFLELEINTKILIKELKDKYSLQVISLDPLKIKKIQKKSELKK